MNRNDHERLTEIHGEIQELLEEARRLVQHEGGIEWERAKSYWLAHIETALSKETGYLGGSMFTMEDTLRALEPDEGDDEGDWDDDEDSEESGTLGGYERNAGGCVGGEGQ